MAIAINFAYSKDTDEEWVMHSKSDNVEILIYDKADEVIQKLFESLLPRYRAALEELMNGSGFIFVCVDFLH